MLDDSKKRQLKKNKYKRNHDRLVDFIKTSSATEMGTAEKEKKEKKEKEKEKKKEKEKVYRDEKGAFAQILSEIVQTKCNESDSTT